MAAGWSSGGSFKEITGHCYLTVKRGVFNINNQNTLNVIYLWHSEALLSWAPPFSFHEFKHSRDVSELCRKALRRLLQRAKMWISITSIFPARNAYIFSRSVCFFQSVVYVLLAPTLFQLNWKNIFSKSWFRRF